MVATPATVRRANQRTVLRLLGKVGSASRAELAKATGMSQPTAGKIVDELLEAGILEEVPDATPNGSTPRLGRPGRIIRLDSQRPRFVAVQLGVSHTRLAMLPIAIPTDEPWAVQFATPATAQAWVRKLDAAARKLPAVQPLGVLVTIPGVTDESTGRVLLSPNLHWTERVSVPALAGRVWNAPVSLIQEIRALAMGHLSARPDAGDFLLVDFGQGVGAAAMIGGKLFTGALALSGELGHTAVLGNARRCGCGGIGCVETLVSRSGLLESFARSAGAKRDWKALAAHVQKHGVERWLADALEAAGLVIAGALNVLGVRQVVITGSLTELPPVVVEHLAGAVRRGAMWARFGEVECHPAPRRWAAGLVAAGIDRMLAPALET